MTHSPASRSIHGSCTGLFDALELPRLIEPTPRNSSPATNHVQFSSSAQFTANHIIEQNQDTTDSHGHTCARPNDQHSPASQKPSCCRNLTHSFQRELTLRGARLNKTSSQIATRLPRNTQSVIMRLSEARRHRQVQPDENMTFSPKLNTLSIKLARERSERLEEVQIKAAELTAAKLAEFYSEYTFKPKVSEKSLKIAENLGIGFLTRQQIHQQKRKKMVSLSIKPSSLNVFMITRLRKHINCQYQPGLTSSPSLKDLT